MALITTFASSPLTSLFYPVWYQKKVDAWRRGEIDWKTGKPLDGTESTRDAVHYDKLAAQKIKRFTVYLRLDSMPNLLAFTSLFGGIADKPTAKYHPKKAISESKDTADSAAGDAPPTRPVEAYGIRLVNLTDRGSSVMQVSEVDNYTAYDPVVNTFRTFGRLHGLAISGEVMVVPESSFAETLALRASDSDMLLLPWSETGGMSEQTIIEDKGTKNKLAASSYISFVNSTLEESSIPVAVLINKNFGGSKNKDKSQRLKLRRTISTVSLSSARDITAPIADLSHHVFCPFFGGADDQAAVRLLLQLAENPQITATVVHFDIPDSMLGPSTVVSTSVEGSHKADRAVVTTTGSSSREQDASFFAALRASLPIDLANRVVFETVSSATPVEDMLARASIEVGQSPKNAGDLILLGRNIARNDLLVAAHPDEIRSSNSVSNTLGVLVEKVWEAKLGASMLVVKAGV